MKTFDKKDVLSALTLEEAAQYKSKEGYFANNIKDLQREVDNNRIDTLCEIKEEAQWGLVFQYHYGLVGHDCSSLFLPADKVKEVEEPKYRPFKTTEEFSKVTGKRIGSILKFRCIGHDKRYYTRMYTGFHILENGNIYIELGSEAYSLEQLYNYDEWLDEQGEWQPFGVEE